MNQEEFLRYITEQAYNVAKSESKPRRNIAYKDVGKLRPLRRSRLLWAASNSVLPAAAVAKFDNLQFLSDTVPRTMTYKQYKERKASDDATKTTNPPGPVVNDSTAKGNEAGGRQRSIAHMMQGQTNTNGSSNGVTTTPQRRSHSMANSPIVDRTVQPEQNGHANSYTGDEDVEMQG